MNQHEENINATVSARRRLLRGLIASPAVLPLSAGAQTTAAASNLNCVRNGAGMTNPVNTTTELPWTASGDNWVRVKLWRVEKPGGTQGDGPYRYYAKGDDLVLIANGNAVVSPAPSAGAWVLVLDSTTSDAGTYRPGSNHTVGTGFVSTTGFPIPGWDNNTIASDFAGNIATPVDQWAGVRFDGSGRVTGVVDLTGGGTGTSALAKTCWTSFSGFKAYPG